jgi:hypothetical protein
MEATRNVEGGKFVKLVLEDGAVTILGDFFVHPEEAIRDVETVVEDALEESAPGERADAVETAVGDYVDREDVDLVGIGPAVIADLAVEVAG